MMSGPPVEKHSTAGPKAEAGRCCIQIESQQNKFLGESYSSDTQYNPCSPSRKRSVKVGMTMYCPNCGLANPDNAKFCANCGTPFGGNSSPQPSPRQTQSPNEPPPAYQPPGPYQLPGPAGRRRFLSKDIGIGCLILVLILLFFGVSCARACFGRRGRVRMRRRY
jgi:hypothetical protein